MERVARRSRRYNGESTGALLARPVDDLGRAAKIGIMSPSRVTFGFLHLAGLHTGTRDESWHWPHMKEMLLRDLERMHDWVGPVDVVFLAGDLTRHGAAAEFDQVDRMLEAVFEGLARLGSHPQLLAVPGAQELNPLQDRFDPVIRGLRRWHSDAELRDHVFGSLDNPFMTRMRAAFADYATWDARGHWRTAPRSEGLLPGDSAMSLTVGGARVGVVGLNSAFRGLVAGGRRRSMDVDPRQLHVACGHDAPAWLGRHHFNFLLTRHPPAELAPRARRAFLGEVDVPGRFAAHLSGDGDGEAARETSEGGAPPRILLPGVALSSGYNAGRVEQIDGVTSLGLYPRRMYRHRLDQAQDCELNDQGAMHFEVRTEPRKRLHSPSARHDAKP